MQGAMTSAIAYIRNETLHKGSEIIKAAEEYLEREWHNEGTGENGGKISCSIFVHAAYRNAGYEYEYLNTKEFPNSTEFKQVTTPKTGDVVLYKRGHMGLNVENPPANVRADYHILSTTMHKGVAYGGNHWFTMPLEVPRHYRHVE
jgi:hypothetical protein